MSVDDLEREVRQLRDRAKKTEDVALSLQKARARIVELENALAEEIKGREETEAKVEELSREIESLTGYIEGSDVT